MAVAAVAVPPVVVALPFVAWILLATLAFGSFAFIVITRQLTDVTTGYARFMAVSAAIFGVLVYLAKPGPAGIDGSGLAINAGADMVNWGPLLTIVFVVLAVAYGLLVDRQRPALVIGAVGCLIGLAVLFYAALNWAPSGADAVPFLVQLAVLSLATGGSMAAIVLGHWYLVTPKISERPLILQCRLLLAMLIIQALLFVVWTTLTGPAPGHVPFSTFANGPVLLVALRLLVTIAFPIVLVWMAWRTSLTRSMESATGLLYINFAAVLAGTIGAAALYVANGILV
jgi:hypothetical protein